MREIRSKIINSPEFGNYKSKTITNINKEVEKEKVQHSNTPSENFSFRFSQQNHYNNLGYYESHHASEMSEKNSHNEKVQSHTIREKQNINHSMTNKTDEIKIKDIILSNINARKKKEYKSDLIKINHKTDLNKSAINSIQEKMLDIKFIEKIKKKSFSKSQKKEIEIKQH